MSYVIVASFDNCDPSVFGPYPTEAEARAKIEAVWNKVGRDDSTESVVVRPLRAL